MFNLRQEILREHSRKQTNVVADWVGGDAERFGQLMQCFLTDQYRVVQRAAAMVNTCVEQYPHLIAPYHRQLMAALPAAVHDAVPRNIVRMWQFVDLPEEHLGEIFEICCQFVTAKGVAIAIRAFAMSVLERIAVQEPDFCNEVKYLIEDVLSKYPDGAAIQSRGKKIIKNLSSLSVPNNTWF